MPSLASNSLRYKISSGVPSAATCPLSMIMTRSANRAASARRCSISTIVRPYLCLSRVSAEKSITVPVQSSEEVGSSRTRILGCIERTAAIATRCCSPPESSFTRRPRRCSIPIACTANSTRRCTSSSLRPRLRGPHATSSSIVRQKSCMLGRCKISPT